MQKRLLLLDRLGSRPFLIPLRQSTVKTLDIAHKQAQEDTEGGEQVASQLGAAGLKQGLSSEFHGLPFYFIYPRLVTDEARNPETPTDTD